MSARNSYSPKCILAGEITPLAISLAKSLENMSCTPLFFPIKITAPNHKINQENTISNQDLIDYQIDGIRYVFYFAPESILADKNMYHEHFSLMSFLSEYAAKINAKTTYITRDLKEYPLPQTPYLVGLNIEKLKLDTHLQQLSLMLNTANNFKNKFVVSDVFHTQIIRENPLIINSFFIDLPQKIYLYKSENHLLHPAHVDDISTQIIKTTFTQSYNSGPIQITGTTSISVINFALNIKNIIKSNSLQQAAIEPTIDINHYQSLAENQIVINTKESIENQISNTINWCLSNPRTTKKSIKAPKIPTQKVVVKPSATIQKKNKIKLPKISFKSKLKPSSKAKKQNKLNYKIYALGLLVILVLIILPPWLFIRNLKTAINMVEQQDYQASLNHAKKASIYFKNSSPALFIAKPIAGSLLPSKTDYDSWVYIAGQASSLINDLEETLPLSKDVINQIISNQKGDPFTKIQELSSQVETVYNKLSSIQARLETINADNYNPSQANQINILSNSIGEYRKKISDLSRFLSISPEFLGNKESKTYLVLLQNNTELRATGGFIGSFALLTFEEGKLLDIETYDVYSADGQLRGHVEPPKAIKEYLGEANWYLRDSNWDPDFPTSARRAEWFLDKELSRQVDGTIGINLYVIKDLLSAIGGIEIPDYQETITADNLFQRAEYFSELNYFDGSSQKKDFLASLINALYIKISSEEGSYGIKALTSFLNSADQSQLQLSLRDEKLESVLEDSSFSGTIHKLYCPDEATPCLNDYFSIIESNVGVNKVNYFIRRSLDHSISIQRGKVNINSTLLLTNTAETAAWPAGTYKNYIRFLVPEEASIRSVQINGKSIRAADLDITSINNYKTVGFLVEVPINSQKTISVDYSLNYQEANQNLLKYQLYLEKQSGTSSDPVNISINTDGSLTPIFTNMGEIQNKQVYIQTTNTKDSHIQIDFTK